MIQCVCMIITYLTSTFNCCVKALGVGIRFIAAINEALSSYNEDTKVHRIPRIG